MEKTNTRKEAAKKSLKELAEDWKRLERQTAEQRLEADSYYENFLMEPIIQTFVENHADQKTSVECLILSVGTSYEPLVLNIKLLAPQKILFLYTKASEEYLDKVVKYCDLNQARYKKSIVHETEPLDIYREIKKAYLDWNKPEKIFIDFTGGTKAMSVAAAMAGVMIGVQLLYVGSTNYLVDFRKPDPGTEKLFYIDNPLKVFGDIEIEKALTLFGEYNYAGAAERLSTLKEDIPDPNIRQELNFAYLLARGYEAWDALDFPAAYENIKNLNWEILRDRRMHGKFLLMDFAERLEKQEKVLLRLVKIPELISQKKHMDILTDSQYILPLMFTMYINAFVREEQEKYDMAALLLYRLLEMIEQRRLARYGIYASQADYKNISYDFEQMPDMEQIEFEEERIRKLTEKFNEIREKLYGQKSKSVNMPEKIGLMDGFVILLALRDPISMRKNGKHIEKLNYIRSMVALRNNSIFAHGLEPVGKENFRKFKQFVEEMFIDLCRIEQINFKEEKSIVTWINPMDSKYYTGMEA